MKKLKNIVIFLVSTILIFIFASYIYSEASFEQRAREVKTMTEAQLSECIKEKFRTRAHLGSNIIMSSTATDREVMEAQCLYEDFFVHRI